MLLTTIDVYSISSPIVNRWHIVLIDPKDRFNLAYEIFALFMLAVVIGLAVFTAIKAL